MKRECRSGQTGVAKKPLETTWLSACEGSNPSSRIIKKSNTKIGKQLRRKTDKELVETILKTKKDKNWLEVARVLSGARRKKVSVNLDQINEKTKDRETLVVPGKVLSQGSVDKKIKIIALSFSKAASSKLKKAGVEFSTIKQEIGKIKVEVRVWK